MYKKGKFLICKHCGNLIEKMYDSGVKIMCCGEFMGEITANTEEASKEKHLPVVEDLGSSVKVKIGGTDHPMVSEHYIPWVYLECEESIQRKELKPEDGPTAEFCIVSDKPKAVYAYCNIHGLWKTNI